MRSILYKNNEFTKLAMYLLSLIFAYGPINPFMIGGKEIDESTSPLLTLSFVLFIVLYYLFNYKNDKKRVETQYITSVLICFYIAISLGDIVYDVENANFFFLLKLLGNMIGFVFLYMFFVRNPTLIDKSLLVFAFSCCSIVLMYFLNILDGLSDTHNGRLWLFGENPNNTSSRMSIGFLILFYYGTRSEKNIYKFLCYALCGLLFYYIIQSGSRGSFLATVIGILFLLLSTKETIKSRLLQIIGIILGIIILYPLVIKNGEIGLFSRLESLSEGDSREILILNALEIAADYPILGCGNNGYLNEKLLRGMELLDSHNILASVLVMSGIVGLLTFLSFWYKLCRISIASYSKCPLGLTLLLSIIFIAMKTGGVLTYMFMWYIYAITAAMAYDKITLNTKIKKK